MNLHETIRFTKRDPNGLRFFIHTLVSTLEIIQVPYQPEESDIPMFYVDTEIVNQNHSIDQASSGTIVNRGTTQVIVQEHNHLKLTVTGLPGGY